ncbi:MAG: NOL1/NOP2/sun family putative RNA methylase [Erysipelotrichaceae bacterium]|nr:NOL1/NOP2/sun family putative RNA methylase [Erysipelotrichaceae bacterium]
MKEAFLQRMQELLKEEYPQFVESLMKPRFRGVRKHPLKLSQETLHALFPYPLKRAPFCADMYYLPQGVEALGNHPLHFSGAIYIQEPSASAPAEVLGVEEGDWVLDLCAAPGGKSTQIAGKLANSGLLVANEYDAKRAHILLSNMERMGFGETIITNAHPKEFAQQCAGWFDKVLVDAPCSGEGMMKKHDAAGADWSIAHVNACADRQVQILISAIQALKENGVLVYSTCTYAPEENEMVVARILKQCPDLKQEEITVSFGRIGVPCAGMDHTKVRRIFPMDGGEGHFIAKFRKCGKTKQSRIRGKKPSILTTAQKQQLQTILNMPTGYYQLDQDQLYFRLQPFIELGSIRILRQGIRCGTFIKQRFEPHQHLFTAVALHDAFHQYYECDEAHLQQFLRGEELDVKGYHGYTAITWQSLPIGFGKGDGTHIKNKYPKGLRHR